MGAGPQYLAQNGLTQVLQNAGFELLVETIEANDPFLTEIDTAFQLNRKLANKVREAHERGDFPLVLSGNCNSALGAIAGLAETRPGMVWFDAHGDFNTPETTESTFFDGMGLAIAAGYCWRKLAATIPGFRPTPPTHIVHVGGRDFDSLEAELLAQSGVNIISSEQMRRDAKGVVSSILNSLGNRFQTVYVHIDLDVLDPATTPANSYAGRVPDGLTAEQVQTAIKLISEQFQIAAPGSLPLTRNMIAAARRSKRA